MTSNPESSRPAPAPVAYSPARWKLQRVSDDRIDLLISTDPAIQATRIPMGNEEAYFFSHNLDRVQGWAAAEAEGTFTQPVSSPEEVRKHLSIEGYIVTSPSLGNHTRLVQATAYANWVEEVPPANAGEVAWFVNVFGVDHEQFWQACVTHGATQEPATYTGKAAADG